MTDIPDLAILVVAAGRGERAGAGMPKQYRTLLGKPVLRWTIENLQSARPDAALYVVISEQDCDLYKHATTGLGLPAPIMGGASRQDSVRNGLQGLPAGFDGLVLIHDAARPFPSASMIDRLVGVFEDESIVGVAPGLVVADSLRRCDSDGLVIDDVDRAGLWSVQTPQVFRYRGILRAHTHAERGLNASDDLTVARQAGAKVTVVPGDEGNFKITTFSDFARAERHLMQERLDVRVGQGFDVHAFHPGDRVTLCGVEIPHDASLAGHSDADVALHALTDAVLGAIGEGDIGVHFPPSDGQWRGAASSQFLKYACDLVARRYGVIAQADVTIICEAPKISPHRESMIASLSQITGLPSSRLSVKGTTTERLGFTGRREGIAALATATIRLPL